VHFTGIEGDVVLDVRRRVFRVGVVPSRVAYFFTVYLGIQVVGRAFPRTDRCGLRVFRHVRRNGVWREVVVAFDDNGVVGLG